MSLLKRLVASISVLSFAAAFSSPPSTTEDTTEPMPPALSLPQPDTNKPAVKAATQSTVENILCALVELQRAFWLNRVKKVLLVTSTYHMRRSLAIARYLFPIHIDIVPGPADDNNTNRDTWMNTPKGRERAKREALNIVECVKNGVIPDFEI